MEYIIALLSVIVFILVSYQTGNWVLGQDRPFTLGNVILCIPLGILVGSLCIGVITICVAIFLGVTQIIQPYF